MSEEIGQYSATDMATAAAQAFRDGVASVRPASAAVVPEGLLDWAVGRWHSECLHRPLQNVHRRSLDDTWRQVIRKLGGDPDYLLGPDHSTLLAAPAQPASGLAVEAVEVVGYLDAHDCLWNETTHPDRMIPLMTVGQHHRIMAASVPAGCKVVPVELLERLEHVTRTLVPHLQCHVDLRALLASAEGVKDE